MTPIQYKINARKAMTGKAYIGAKDLLPTNSVVPESAGGTPQDVVATVSFGASAYTGTEHDGHIRLQVTCARCDPSMLVLQACGCQGTLLWNSSDHLDQRPACITACAVLG